MNINIHDMPENKSFDEYPDDTVFVHAEKAPRYDKKELLENNAIKLVFYGDKNYNNALTKEDAKKLIKI